MHVVYFCFIIVTKTKKNKKKTLLLFFIQYCSEFHVVDAFYKKHSYNLTNIIYLCLYIYIDFTSIKKAMSVISCFLFFSSFVLCNFFCLGIIQSFRMSF